MHVLTFINDISADNKSMFLYHLLILYAFNADYNHNTYVATLLSYYNPS